MIAALILVAGAGDMLSLAGVDNQERLTDCQFDSTGDYSVTGCTVEPTKNYDPIAFYTDASRVSPTGGADWLGAWYATWLAAQIDASEQAFVTGCYDGASGVSVCTDDEAVFDQITAQSDGFDRSGDCPGDDDCSTEHAFVYDVSRSQLPSGFIDAIEAAGSCTTDLTYTDQDGFTHSEAIEGEFRYSTDNTHGGLVCVHTATRPSDFTNPPSDWVRRTFDADPTEITGGSVQFTVAADLDLDDGTADNSTDDTSDDSTDDTSDDGTSDGDGTDTVDDSGDDDGSTDTTTTGALTSIDRAIINAVTGFIDTVQNTIGL